jgi:hypothetical protein
MKKNMKKMSRITAFEHSSLKKVLAKDAEGAKAERKKYCLCLQFSAALRRLRLCGRFAAYFR